MEAQPINWPPNYDAERGRRMKAHFAATEDYNVRVALEGIYRDDPVRWINDWCVTFDPRLKGSKIIPFMLFPRQVEFILLLKECVEARESALIEKCRDVGASWLCVAFSVWLWLYHPGTTIGWGSRKEEYVDEKGNPKAIFPKIRQLIENLPSWMLPFGFSMREHAPYMKIINPANNSTITGEAGDNIGRGGRSTIFFKDESAHYERPELVEAALSENTDVQIDISSVNGTANVFYRRRMAGIEWSPGCTIERGKTRVFIFDWRDHPGKNQEWYDLKRAKFESEGMLHVFAQEIDRDYSGSVVGVIIKQEWVKACIDAHIKLAAWGDWFEGERIAGQDVADGGGDINAQTNRCGSVIVNSEGWPEEAGDAARTAVPIALQHGSKELYYDSIGVGTGFKVEINHMMQEDSWPRNLRVMKWNASADPLDKDNPVIPGDPDSPTNGDQYLNLKAQSWFRGMQRIYKTYKAVTQGIRYPVEEMISFDSKMPHLHRLCLEFSQPVKKTSQNGKTMVDKKPEAALSPNLADSAIMCLNPTRELSIFDVL